MVLFIILTPSQESKPLFARTKFLEIYTRWKKSGWFTQRLQKQVHYKKRSLYKSPDVFPNFQQNFNISFFTPKNLCDLCSSYNNAMEKEKEGMLEKYDNHLREKVLSRAEKEEDKKKAFLILGHTQNEGDNVHSVIKKSVNRAFKSGSIFIPTDYVRLILSAKKTGNPYKVTKLSYQDFVDLKTLSQQLGSNYNKTANNELTKTSLIKILKVQKSDPGILFVKTTYEQKKFAQINVNNNETDN